MQIPILNGIKTDSDANFRIEYPLNMIPVPTKNGISNGYYRPADGIIQEGSATSGVSRGGINWNDVCYRVLGSKISSIDSAGVETVIDDVGGTTSQVSLDYSFDYLGILSDLKFFLYDGATVVEVTDVDLGDPIDFIWIDGYFMLTDGEFIIVTELADPFQIDPLKYGSAELDPDPIKALLKLRNEPYALNRYTIEVFQNVGGSGFPFQVVDGAQIDRGVVGTHACCIYVESIAFVGGGRNEAIAVWIGRGGSSVKISDKTVDLILEAYTDAEIEAIVLEARVDKSHQFLYMHLPDRTMVYDAISSNALGEPVWFTLSSSGNADNLTRYLAKDLVYCYRKWMVGDPTTARIGYYTQEQADHWLTKVAWEFSTMIIYNDGKGAIVHELELVALTGRVQFNIDTLITTAYTFDGEVFSTDRSISAGRRGQYQKRLIWLSQGNMRHWRIQRFRGQSDAFISPIRLEVRIEPLGN